MKDRNINKWMAFNKMLLIVFAVLSSSTLMKAQNHILLSEVSLQPDQAEFIEINNPTNSVVDLANYYLADNQKYPYVPNGFPVNVGLGDFVVQFPSGSTLNPGQTIVIAMTGSAFETNFAQMPDYEITSSDPTITDMIVLEFNGGAKLTNGGEGIVLFYWDGISNVVKDVDLMNVGIPSASSVIVDKTSIPGYLPDAYTIPVQNTNGPPQAGFSTKRILVEGINEVHAGGNGINGDDETTEDIETTWDKVYTAPNPGSIDFVVSGALSSSLSSGSFLVYPNPATMDEIKLSVSPEIDHFKIEILNNLGELISSKYIAHRLDDEVVLDISSFVCGVYYVVIHTGQHMIGKKVIVY